MHLFPFSAKAFAAHHEQNPADIVVSSSLILFHNRNLISAFQTYLKPAQHSRDDNRTFGDAAFRSRKQGHHNRSFPWKKLFPTSLLWLWGFQPLGHSWGTLEAAPSDPRGSCQHFTRWIYRSSITSDSSDLIRPKLLRVFENITNLAGNDPVHVVRTCQQGIVSSCQKSGSAAFLAPVAGGQSQGKIPVPAWSGACGGRELQPSSSSSRILFPARSPQPLSSFPQPRRELSAPGWKRESSKGSKTHSAPQPETQQSTRGLPDLFQTGLAPAEPLSPRARAHKPIKTPHVRSSSCLRRCRGHASELGGLLRAASPLSWWARSRQSSSKHREPGNSSGSGTD